MIHNIDTQVGTQMLINFYNKHLIFIIILIPNIIVIINILFLFTLINFCSNVSLMHEFKVNVV